MRGPDNEYLGFGHSTGDLIRIETGQLYFDPSSSTPVTHDFTVDLAIAAAGYLVEGRGGGRDLQSGAGRPDRHHARAPGSPVRALQTYFYDYTTPGTDTIHFAMSFLDGSGTGSGVLAVCHFTALQIGTTPLDFVTVDVRDPDNQPYVFEHSTGDNIIIDQVIATDVRHPRRREGELPLAGPASGTHRAAHGAVPGAARCANHCRTSCGRSCAKRWQRPQRVTRFSRPVACRPRGAGRRGAPRGSGCRRQPGAWQRWWSRASTAARTAGAMVARFGEPGSRIARVAEDGLRFRRR